MRSFVCWWALVDAWLIDAPLLGAQLNRGGVRKYLETFTFAQGVTDSQANQASKPSGFTIQPATPTTPAALSSLAVNPGCVTAGDSVIGAVSPSGPAPSGGATVFLQDDETNVEIWPAASGLGPRPRTSA